MEWSLNALIRTLNKLLGPLQADTPPEAVMIEAAPPPVTEPPLEVIAPPAAELAAVSVPPCSVITR